MKRALLIFIVSFMCLSLPSEFGTLLRKNLWFSVDAAASGEKNERIKKIKERIRKAGLTPREAKYYRIVE